MANVTINDLPLLPGPLNPASIFFEVEALISGEQVSRKVSLSQVANGISGTTLNSTLRYDGAVFLENLLLFVDPTNNRVTINGGVNDPAQATEHQVNAGTGFNALVSLAENASLRSQWIYDAVGVSSKFRNSVAGTPFQFEEGNGVNIAMILIPNAGQQIRHANVSVFDTQTYGVQISGTGAIRVPVGTTAQEPAPVNGMLRYDSTLNAFRGVTGGVWASLGGGGGGSVNSVNAGTNINITGPATDPIVNLVAVVTGISVNGVTLSTVAGATSYLRGNGAYGEVGLTELSDVTITAPVNNQTLYRTGGIWVNTDRIEILAAAVEFESSPTAATGMRLGVEATHIRVADRTDTDTAKIEFWDGDMFQTQNGAIGHYGSAAELQVRSGPGTGIVSLRNQAGTVTMARFTQNAASELMHNNILRLATNANGSKTTGTLLELDNAAASTETRLGIWNSAAGIALRADATTGAGRIVTLNNVGVVLGTQMTFVNAGAVGIYFSTIEVLRTLAAANGGAEANNTLTGAGFERIMTVSDFNVSTVVGSFRTRVATANVNMPDATFVTGLTALSLASSARYSFEAVLIVTSPAADDFQWDISGEPASSTGNGYSFMREGTSPGETVKWTLTTTNLHATSGSTDVVHIIGEITTGGSSGSFSLRVAKQADTGADGTLFAGSWMRIQRLA